ncbi:acetyltransferase (GNAT) family protein [Kribbella amoyensis]|uniref:Acetyltransferase (GNAT) family protein n=1 Tax=Kribbella amoyensis TaxID=996641 RepID=A0A561BRC6_9ACTN|nr:GNAT family N-acetyltransferase [Kribbella amoyensis]TWD81332.1 acetyltransferase (GNAT) family protein [Kribbella amoyensis]
MIRTLDPADPAIGPRLLAIQHAAYAVEAELIGFDGIPPLREDLPALMASTEHWLGRFVDDALVAAVAYELPDDRTVDITRLVVDPAYARQGHARALLDSLDDVQPRPVAVVSTGTANTPAIALYQGRGFEETDRLEIAPGVTITRFRRSRDEIGLT